jgi:hypothetical protein
VASQSPHSSPGQRRARTEAGAVKEVTLDRRWVERAHVRPFPRDDFKEGIKKGCTAKADW